MKLIDEANIVIATKYLKIDFICLKLKIIE